MRIYLKGAYGPSNIGDDLLLHVTLDLVARAFPQANIYTTFRGDLAVAKVIYNQVEHITKNELVKQKFDLIIHGGGGQFFSFADSKNNQNFDPLPIRIFKRLFSKKGRKRLMGGLRSFFDAKRSYALIPGKRIGIGMGVGPFVPGSRRETEAKAVLDQMSFITVREEKSLQEYDRMISNQNAYLKSDLSLYKSCWITEKKLSNLRAIKGSEGKKVIAICMRSWHQPDLQKDIIQSLKSFIENAQALGFEVTLLSVCNDTDPYWLPEFSDLNVLTYEPAKEGITAYLEELKKNISVIVSARAHVTILASQVGIPVITVPLERKLYWANSLRGRDGDMWETDLSHDKLMNQVEHCISNTEAITAEVCKNLDVVCKRSETEIDNLVEKMRDVLK